MYRIGVKGGVLARRSVSSTACLFLLSLPKIGVHDAIFSISLCSLRISTPNTIPIHIHYITVYNPLLRISVGLTEPDCPRKLAANVQKRYIPTIKPVSRPSATSAMTTNLNAIAGPSKLPPSPLVEIESPTQSLDSPGRDAHRGLTQEPTVSRPGLSVDENGEIIKVPAFLNKLFRSVRSLS